MVGLDTFFYRGCDFGAEVGQVESLSRDVREVAPAELEGFDAIVHLAALSNDPLGDLDAGLTAEINCDATLRLARAAREAGVRRFVFASSCSMYGASETDVAVDEDAPLKPLTAVRRVEGAFGGGTRRACGAGFRSRLDAKRDGVRRLAAPASRHRAQQPRGMEPHHRPHSLAQRRIGVEAARARAGFAKATLALLDAPEEQIRGEAVNVGSNDQNYLIRDLAEQLSEITGCVVEIAEGSSADQRSYRVDFSKLGRLLPGLTLDWNAERGGARTRRRVPESRSHQRRIRR